MSRGSTASKIGLIFIAVMGIGTILSQALAQPIQFAYWKKRVNPNYVLVQSASGTGSSGTATINLTQANQAGDLLVVAVYSSSLYTDLVEDYGTISVSDSSGNTWSAGPPAYPYQGVQIWFAPGIAAASAGANTITVADTYTSDDLVVSAMEYSG